ncbi:MAG: glutamine--tRNA ligase/YqeY domain fusion protein [Candidatus Latescibacteria bacterium]|nr:glutamine--tRNA ligase/YqeY domain fusion protein [Candidatus Latescibacterota bacterium]
MSESTESGEKGLDFIRTAVAQDRAQGRYSRPVMTRFPPEPNGYLHIGHAKAIATDFGVAADFKGLCNLRMDDTNPEKEDLEFVESIKEDITWLGYDWGDRFYFASDYFDQLHAFALRLIEKSKAYVDSLDAEETRQYRGTLTEAGKDSPYRDRSVAENLDLFERMRQGEFAEGEHVLRAKIDMASPNITLRDPTLYRIRKTAHYRLGDAWCIYPMYDFTQCLSDAIEGVTHSLCTLEFVNNRALYDWVLEEVETPEPPRQIEFARLSLSYTVLSKRYLLEMVQEGIVNGWDDPRMPTISGLRRRGYTPESLRRFCDEIGVAKRNNLVNIGLLEFSIREDLNRRANRVMGVLDPLKVVITNYPEGQVEDLEAINNPEDPAAGSRTVPFSRELYVERDDFREVPFRKYFRLAPGREVRLRYGYFITCDEVIKDEAGEVVELRCTYDPATRGGQAPDGRKVRGTIHWVSAAHALPAQVRLYDRLFTVEAPTGATYKDHLNPDSLQTLTDCMVEPSLKEAAPGSRFQFERQGYFCIDSVDSTPDNLVINRTVSLRDSWARLEKQQQQQGAKKGG